MSAAGNRLQFGMLLAIHEGHYENTPMQYTAIFHGRKNDNFQMKNCDIFLIFAHPELLYTCRDVRFDNTIALIRLTNCLPLTMTVIIGQVTKIFRSHCFG